MSHKIKLNVRDSVEQDCFDLANKLRKEDIDEICAGVGDSPLSALMAGLSLSEECKTLCLLGRPIAMFGVSQAKEDASIGIAWMLGSDEITNSGVDVLRLSKQWMKKMCENYMYLTNLIDIRNKTHLRWLKWLGCEFSEELHNFGPEGRTFVKFIYNKEASCVTQP